MLVTCGWFFNNQVMCSAACGCCHQVRFSCTPPKHVFLPSLQVAAAGRELALLQQQLAAAESEAAGLHTALQDAQERHAHQLCK
jgi:hypothetical protein